MDTPTVGYVLAINIINFDGKPNLRRGGSLQDEKDIKEVFEGLGFALYRSKVHRDKTCDEIKTLVEEFSKDPIQDHCSCSVVVIMSHGSRYSRIYGRDYDHTVHVNNELVPMFANDKAIGLRGKPKLFFIQACR